MDRFAAMVGELLRANVQLVVIGVWGANYYARSGGTIFATQDRDLFLPGDVDNLVRAWRMCEKQGLSLWAGNEPLDQPRIVDDVQIPVARLTDIVQSKANAGRDKDRLFLATHEEALKHLMIEPDRHT